jgi:hypothetical protein
MTRVLAVGGRDPAAYGVLAAPLRALAVKCFPQIFVVSAMLAAEAAAADARSVSRVRLFLVLH